MPIDHDYIQVAADGAGKRVGNVKQTDPDAEEVYLQKTVTWDPEDETDAGAQRVTDGRAHTQQRAEVAEATGTLGALDQAVTLDLTGQSGAVYTLVGDLVGTVRFEGRISAAADWQFLNVFSQYHGDYVFETSGGSELWDQGTFFDVDGYESVRLRCSAYTSGASAALLRTTNRSPIQRIAVFEPIGTTSAAASQVDGHSATLGEKTDAAWAGGGGGSTIVAILKGIFGRLPLTGGGKLDVQVSSADGALVSIGTTSDADATGGGTIIGVLKRLRTLLAAGLPAALGAGGGLKVDGSGTALPVSGTFWQATQPVSGTVTAVPSGNATATLSNVSDTATSTTLLAANADRRGAAIHNDSTAVLYVKFGTTASATSYTVKMVADAYYEVPFDYTGRIDGIWASDAAGSARITEIS